MRSRRALVLAGGLALLAGRLLADDKREVRLLPEAEVDFEETFELDGSIEAMDPGSPAESVHRRMIEGRVHRRVTDLVDGLAHREDFRLELVKLGMKSATGVENLLPPETAVVASVTRSGKSRIATGALLPGRPDPYTQQAEDLLLRDPDALPRALQPSSPVAEKDSWEIDPKSLLHLFAPENSKLVTEGSHARATLESFTTKKDTTEAKVKLDALVVFRDPAAAKDAHSRLKLWATLHASTDGSRPPRKETVEYQFLMADGTKHVVKYELTRTLGK